MGRLEPIENPSITSVPGVRAAGLACGIKRSGKPDLALVCSDLPAAAAATFTTNQFPAAPVVYDRALLKTGTGTFRGVVANSGIANAFTGEAGLANARRMAATAEEACGVPRDSFFAFSTGVIGAQLPMDVLVPGIHRAASALSADGGPEAAQAIMTTDTRPKTAGVTLHLSGGTVHLAGMAKGAGMIQPSMATMFALLCTDAIVPPALLQELLAEAVQGSFNRITVDGCMSTNDTVLLLANGAAGIAPTAADWPLLAEGLAAVSGSLARQIVRDGEGATKLVEIVVEGARDDASAQRVALAIGNSNLVKTALYGADPNWGRFIAAAGSVGVPMRAEDVRLRVGEAELVRYGQVFPQAEAAAHEAMTREELTVWLEVGSGPGRGQVWTCDLTPGYIHENADYRT